jgi:hypothetical protein
MFAGGCGNSASTVGKISMKKFLIAGFALLLGGCASIISGDKQKVTVVTPGVKDAACRLADGRRANLYLPRTPATVWVKKGDGPLDIACEKQGYETGEVVVRGSLMPHKAGVGFAAAAAPTIGLAFGRIAFSSLMIPMVGAGVFGLAVDLSTGALIEYPDTITVAMKPAAGEAAPPDSARPTLASRVAGLKRLKTMKVAAAVVPIRATPDPVGEILTLVRAGEVVEIVGDTPSGWLKVANQGTPVGWVHWTAFPLPRHAIRVGSARL